VSTRAPHRRKGASSQPVRERRHVRALVAAAAAVAGPHRRKGASSQPVRERRQVRALVAAAAAVAGPHRRKGASSQPAPAAHMAPNASRAPHRSRGVREHRKPVLHDSPVRCEVRRASRASIRPPGAASTAVCLIKEVGRWARTHHQSPLGFVIQPPSLPPSLNPPSPRPSLLPSHPPALPSATHRAATALPLGVRC
jgi:hypothetical protein